MILESRRRKGRHGALGTPEQGNNGYVPTPMLRMYTLSGTATCYCMYIFNDKDCEINKRKIRDLAEKRKNL